MRFIWTGDIWVNADKIKHIAVEEPARVVKKEWLDDAKEMGFEINKDEITGEYHTQVGKVILEMDDGSDTEYDILTNWKTPEQAKETARKLIKELEDR